MQFLLVLERVDKFIDTLGFDAGEMNQSLFFVFDMLYAFLIFEWCFFDGLH